MFNQNRNKMKKVMFALCFMFGGIAVVTAQEKQDTTSNQYRTETQSPDMQSQDGQSQDSLSQDSQTQSQSQSQYPQDAMAQQDRERIQATELPDEVKRALEGEEYRGWLISGAFKSTGGDEQSMSNDSTSTDANRQGNANATGAEDEEVYIVELKNGAETKSVRFDSNGQKMEGQEEDVNSQNNQYNQNNQNGQMKESESSDQNATQQPGQSGQSQSTNPSQSTETQSGQSTSTPSGQSTPSGDQSTGTQTDQSKANEPK